MCRLGKDFNNYVISTGITTVYTPLCGRLKVTIFQHHSIFLWGEGVRKRCACDGMVQGLIVTSYFFLGFCPNTTFGKADEYGVHHTNPSDTIGLTQSGELVQIPCRYGGGYVNGRCTMSSSGRSKWQPFDFSNCKSFGEKLESLSNVRRYYIKLYVAPCKLL